VKISDFSTPNNFTDPKMHNTFIVRKYKKNKGYGRMKIKKVFFFSLGVKLISVGVFIPLLPTTPLF